MIYYTNTISIKEMNNLRKLVGWNILEERQAKAAITNSSYLTVAYDEKKAVGTARVVSDGGYIAIIADVMVHPDYQNKGIGKKLMENIMIFLENSIDDTQCIMVNIMAAEGREGFYEKFEFIRRPSDTMGAGMIKWLGNKK